MKKNIKNNKHTQTSTALVLATKEPSVPLPVLANNPIAPFASFVADLPLDRIVPNPKNPRTEMADEGLNELAESIRSLNVESPILVMPVQEGMYQIVYGERRYRASQLAGKTTIPAKVESMTPEQAEIRAIHENIQRENMTPFDEARAFEKLHVKRGMSISEICATFAKSKAYVENRLNLTKLIPAFAKMVRDKEITLEIALVMAKYDAKIQKKTFDEHFKSNDYYSWRGITAKELDKRLFNAHLTKLKVYNFDKTECKTCANNTSNNILFEECGDCSACRNPKCLQQKNTAYLIEHAIALATGDPYLNLVFIKGEADKTVIETLAKKGHEAKLLDVFIRNLTMPEHPKAPDLSKVEDEDDRNIMQKAHEESIEKYKAECAKLDLAVIKGRKTKYGVIRDKSIEIGYMDVKKETVTCDGVTTDITPETQKQKVLEKDKRNYEIRYEHTVRDLKKEIDETTKHFKKVDELTPLEDQAFHYILLKQVSSTGNMALLGMKGADYDDKKCLEYAKKITPKQKNMLYRMVITHYLNSISENKCLPDKPDVKLMLSFMELHNPKKFMEIDTKYKSTYEKHHQTLTKRAEDLEKEKELLRLKELEETLQKQGLAVDMETGEVLTALPAAQAPNLLPEAVVAADRIDEAEVVSTTMAETPTAEPENEPYPDGEEIPAPDEMPEDYPQPEPERLPDPAEVDPDFIEWETNTNPFELTSAELPQEPVEMPLAA